MKTLQKNIPNIITLINLFFGLCAIIFALSGDLSLASLCIFTSALFDFLDGFIARLFNIVSEFGKQLDSLSDLISFGVAPAMILFKLIYIKHTEIVFHDDWTIDNFMPAIIALIIPLFSAIRLPKFNIDEKQKDSFIGLPTPALAIFIASIALTIHYNQYPNLIFIFNNINFLILISCILPILLVVKINLFSLKITRNKKTSKLNLFRILLILSAIILFFIFQFASIPFIVILYILLSILNNIT